MQRFFIESSPFLFSFKDFSVRKWHVKLLIKLHCYFLYLWDSLKSDAFCYMSACFKNFLAFLSLVIRTEYSSFLAYWWIISCIMEFFQKQPSFKTSVILWSFENAGFCFIFFNSDWLTLSQLILQKMRKSLHTSSLVAAVDFFLRYREYQHHISWLKKNNF